MEGSSVYFNSLLTPQWLANQAQTYEKFTFSNEALLFKDGSVFNHRLIRVRLVKPGLLRDDLRYLVTITLSYVSPISPTTDMDPHVFVSDGVNDIGHDMLDADNYPSLTPLRACEATSSLSPTITCVDTDVRVNNYFVSPQVVNAIYNVGGNQAATGEAYASYDRVISVFHTYTKVLQPSRGLYLDIHRDHANEQYLIKFVKVKVEQELLS